MAASNVVVERSMNISGKKVFANSQTSTMVVPGLGECIVSFDASWHRRCHFSNQGFAAAIDAETGKSSIIHYLTECAIHAPSGMKSGNAEPR